MGKEYNIISGEYSYVIEKVNDALYDGRECLGSVIVLDTPTHCKYIQSMIKKEKDY